MKKILLFIFILFISGCTIVRIDTSDIDNIINVVLSKENTLFNRIGKGFKYYIPRGVTYIDTDGLTDRLYSNGTFYYLYIDVLSFYHNIILVYEENEDAYFSRRITPADGFRNYGFLEINRRGNMYHVEFVYNFARMETVVNRRNLNNAILNAAYILSTIQYNRDFIRLMLDEGRFVNREEVFDNFLPNENSGNLFELHVQNNE